MAKIKTYEIAGKTYEQRPLGIMPAAQLARLFREQSVLLAPGMAPAELIEALGPLLPRAMAIVLTEKGTAPQDKDIDALADEFAYGLDIETALQVITDFFDLTPVHSLVERLTGLIDATRATPKSETKSKPRKS